MEHDRTVIGKQFPDFIYSLQTNIIWKNFDCSIFFQGVQGLEGYQYFLPLIILKILQFGLKIDGLQVIHIPAYPV